MKAVLIMYDSLNRRYLPPYGKEDIIAPNFTRLAEHSVTFDNFYCGSMPCMPARREIQTGRYNFLHRSWGPIEPFDDSIPEMIGKAGVHTHMITDHQHYWEDGGATYHNRYTSYEFVRGQEGDRWKGDVKDPVIPEHLGRLWRQDVVNRSYFIKAGKQPLSDVFRLGLEFLEKNKAEDNWFLHWECFDPHEPFFTVDDKYIRMYPDDYKGPKFDWPDYKEVTEDPDAVQHCRNEYAALLSMCDECLGRFIDFMDENDMWKDTAVIVNTDHGFFLGEHDFWGKSAHPWYNETAHLPLFIWDPRSGKKGERREALVQNIDVAVTILRYFGLEPTPDMLGHDLGDTIDHDAKVREYALFGLHGAHVNITDGRYVYMRAPVTEDNSPLYNYTDMPTHMRCLFSVDEMRQAELHKGFSFTKGVPLLRIPSVEDKTGDTAAKNGMETMLFDLKTDPEQKHPLHDEAVERRMIEALKAAMKENDAPEEQYVRLGL